MRDGAADYGHRYSNPNRMASYWYQVEHTLALGGETALVVGVGSGLVIDLLRREGLRVVGSDVDRGLGAEVIADVRRLPFPERSVDVVVCCQVLEHLPWSDLEAALRSLRRVCRRGVVLSLPDRSPCVALDLRWRFRRRKLLVPLPDLRPMRWSFNGEHHWEVGTRGHSVRAVERRIRAAGFTIEAQERIPEFSYHRFWRLRR